AALHSIHDALRRQLRGTGVRLMKVVPGIVDTDFRSHVLAGAPPPSVRQIRRIVSADPVADAVLQGVRKRRKTVYVPRSGALFTLLGTVAPALMDLYLARLARNLARQAEHSARAAYRETVAPGEKAS